ncbi:hypothetical protein BD779DRAFT_1468811 [Infundibulicybe gibba]|nr:hypothetical protein BD779DRAFT_1468811 [Infundibulicybe gibba]
MAISPIRCSGNAPLRSSTSGRLKFGIDPTPCEIRSSINPAFIGAEWLRFVRNLSNLEEGTHYRIRRRIVWGPITPFRSGRIDAQIAEQPGVPQPQDPIESHLASFQRQGFTPLEMTTLVACGHTLGGQQHDEKHLRQTLRIHVVTGLLGRMIHNVPNEVTFTEEIALLPVKVGGVQLTIEGSQLIFKASIRDACQPRSHREDALARQVSPDISPVTLRLGFFVITYHVVVSIDPSVSISKFWFEVDEHNGTTPATHNNGGSGYQVEQNNVLFIPSLSLAGAHGAPPVITFTFFVAVQNTTKPSRVFLNASDRAIRGAPPPLNSTIEYLSDPSVPLIAGYNFHKATAESPGFYLTVNLRSVVDGQVYPADFQPRSFLGTAAPPLHQRRFKQQPSTMLFSSSYQLHSTQGDYLLRSRSGYVLLFQMC